MDSSPEDSIWPIFQLVVGSDVKVMSYCSSADSVKLIDALRTIFKGKTKKTNFDWRKRREKVFATQPMHNAKIKSRLRTASFQATQIDTPF